MGPGVPTWLQGQQAEAWELEENHGIWGKFSGKKHRQSVQSLSPDGCLSWGMGPRVEHVAPTSAHSACQTHTPLLRDSSPDLRVKYRQCCVGSFSDHNTRRATVRSPCLGFPADERRVEQRAVNRTCAVREQPKTQAVVLECLCGDHTLPLKVGSKQARWVGVWQSNQGAVDTSIPDRPCLGFNPCILHRVTVCFTRQQPRLKRLGSWFTREGLTSCCQQAFGK